MERKRNPFTPSFGKVPPHMAGRDQVVCDLLDALDNGAGDPNLTTILVGARGTGKTALLTSVSREARSRGWVSVDVSARPGMLKSILDRSRAGAAHLIESEGGTRIKSIQVGQLIGLEWEVAKRDQPDWRMSMEKVLDGLSEVGSGLLITVDEVRADLDDMVDLVSVYQHFVREDRPVALLMAGLPFRVSELLSSEDISFLRRAQHRTFGRIPDADIEDALRQTVQEAGRQIGGAALARAAEAIDGFPYMMQLVGYRAWSRNPGAGEITAQDVDEAAALAKRELASGVFDATYKELSDRDRQFLFAMLEDDAESLVADIARRMGVKGNYAGQYKRRLLEQGLIGERGRGRVAFELPGFREYIREMSREAGETAGL